MGFRCLGFWIERFRVGLMGLGIKGLCGFSTSGVVGVKGLWMQGYGDLRLLGL